MDGVEWSSLTINNEQVGEITTTHESLFSESISADGFIEFSDLPSSLKNILIGEVILALPPPLNESRKTATLPTVDEDELRSMSQFLLDKKIPFAIDRMGLWFSEILSQSEQESIALLGAAQNSLIDRFATYSSKKHEVKSIDSRICGWLKLIPFPDEFPQESNECLLIDDGFEVHLVMRNQTLTFTGFDQHLHPFWMDTDAAEQLTYELTYSVQQHAIELPETLSFGRINLYQK